MRVLDIDLDYFLDAPVSERDHSLDCRVTEIDCVRSVWSEKRARDFFENNLGLSKSKKIKGRIFKGHDEALYFWEELISKDALEQPFSVVHIDTHPDLGYGGLGKCYVLGELISRPLELRKTRLCHNCELEGRYYDIDIGDYLLYGVAFRFFSEIIYCANPNADCGAIPCEIVNKHIPDCIDKPTKFKICLKPKCVDELLEDEIPNEPEVPLLIIPAPKDVHFDGNFDFISIAQSPNYTPENADFILKIFEEYIEKI